MKAVDSIDIAQLSPTSYGVKLTVGGITAAFTAKCDDPRKQGYKNDFDIELHSLTSAKGEDVWPFIEEMELTEFFEYELQDFCFENLYIDMAEVEREREEQRTEAEDHRYDSYGY